MKQLSLYVDPISKESYEWDDFVKIDTYLNQQICKIGENVILTKTTYPIEIAPYSKTETILEATIVEIKRPQKEGDGSMTEINVRYPSHWVKFDKPVPGNFTMKSLYSLTRSPEERYYDMRLELYRKILQSYLNRNPTIEDYSKIKCKTFDWTLDYDYIDHWVEPAFIYDNVSLGRIREGYIYHWRLWMNFIANPDVWNFVPYEFRYHTVRRLWAQFDLSGNDGDDWRMKW